MRFVKIPAILPTVIDVGCIRKRIFNAALDSRITFFQNNGFLTMHLFLMSFSLQFHEAPRMVGLKMFQIVCKRTAL